MSSMEGIKRELVSTMKFQPLLLTVYVFMVFLACNELAAQNNSLFQNPLHGIAPAPVPPGVSADGNPNRTQPERANFPGADLPMGQNAYANPQFGIPLASASWTYQPPIPNKVLRLHDIVSIRVDEGARMSAEGRASQRKNALYDGKLSEWLQFEGLDTIKPATQADGDPAVKGQLNTTYRANSDVITREALVFNIAAEVADIRPNGNVVLEAHKSITINDNRWNISLSGMCQSTDIGPDNVVLSRNLIDLKVDKRESGQARDGYRRGWFTELMSRFQPF